MKQKAEEKEEEDRDLLARQYTLGSKVGSTDQVLILVRVPS